MPEPSSKLNEFESHEPSPLFPDMYSSHFYPFPMQSFDVIHPVWPVIEPVSMGYGQGLISPISSISRIGSQVSEHLINPFNHAHSTEHQFPPTPNSSTSSLVDHPELSTSLDTVTKSPKKSALFPCPHIGCDRKFTRKDNIKYHLRTHLNVRPRPFACDSCDKTYYRAIDLARHVAVTHENVKAYSCSSCHLKYTRKEALKRHYQKSHMQYSEYDS